MDIEFVRLPLRSQKGLAIFLLITVLVLVYAPVKDYPFINYDDTLYVTEAPQVQQGLGWDSVVWSMTAMEAANWHPLTWLSHMLDVQLFGLNPAGHHLTNLLLHMANVLLLFGVLQHMTGALWRSALVAALFALHPLNVESVAWVAERKNVLSTLFWLLTMAAYIGYVRKPHWGRYLGMTGIFVLGLMAKPMLVTLPCVLLLLDYWPLGRLGKDSKEFWERLPRLAAEKLPLFIPVAAISVVTIAAQSQAGALSSWEGLPLGSRVANAVLAYGMGLKKMLWPMDLAVFYPHPGNSLAVWPVALAALLLVILSLGVWWQGRRSRYLVVGWLWYLGTLIPVSGLIQVGGQAMADRYAYVPLMGLFIILAWGTAELAQTLRFPKEWLLAPGLCLLVTLALLTRVQLGYWQTTRELFEHALAVTSDNPVAHNALGIELMEEKQLGKAVEHLTQALAMDGDRADTHNNLGLALSRQGRLEEAIQHYQQALQIRPDSYAAHNNLGLVVLGAGRVDEAMNHFSQALLLNPNYVEAYNNLGTVLLKKDNRAQAIELFRKALELRPGFAQAHYNLGTELLKTADFSDSKVHLLAAVEANPDYLDAYVNLGVLLKREGKVNEAIDAYRKALQLNPNHAEAHNNLGTALAQRGDFQQAAHHFLTASTINPNYREAQENLNRLRSRE
jgi:Tfp pilus assembly protein PilF